MAKKARSQGVVSRSQREQVANPRTPNPPRRYRSAGVSLLVATVASDVTSTRHIADDRRLMLASMCAALGVPLTAAISGAGSAAALNGLISGRTAFNEDGDRQLRDAFELAQMLLAVETPDVVQAWLLGMNPLIDDRAPAAVLAQDPAAVLRAARSFVANG